MSMYDRINYKIECPVCKYTANSFQSKDGPCSLAMLEFWEVDNFYDACDNCGTWIEFQKERKPCPITDYKMSYRKKDSDVWLE